MKSTATDINRDGDKPDWDKSVLLIGLSLGENKQ